MSKNKPTPLEVVERYHQRYLEYEGAFNNDPFTEKQRQEEVVKIAESGIDLESEEFLEKMTDAMIDKPRKVADVNNAAAKFIMFTDFYLLTQEDELPEQIQKDYDNLPIKDDIKTHFSIKDGKFVKNEESSIDEETKKYFKTMIEQIKIQLQLK